jgi:hypothetical protein
MLRPLLILSLALLVSGCALDQPETSPQQNIVHPAASTPTLSKRKGRVPEPARGQYVTSFSSTGRWIYCVRDPQLPKRLTGVDEWEYYPSVEAAQRRRPGFHLFRACHLDWPNPAKATG